MEHTKMLHKEPVALPLSRWGKDHPKWRIYFTYVHISGVLVLFACARLILHVSLQSDLVRQGDVRTTNYSSRAKARKGQASS